MGLAVLLAVSLQQPVAWGQLRTKSGAVKSGIEHPKDLERRVFQLTNEARRKNGLPALEPDATLTTMARNKSDDMAKRHYFSHTSPEGKTIIDHYDEEKPAKIGLMGRVGDCWDRYMVRMREMKERLLPVASDDEAIAKVLSGAADAAIVPASLAAAPGLTSCPVDPTLHEPLKQTAAVVAASTRKDAARRALDVLSLPENRDVWKRFGFTGP